MIFMAFGRYEMQTKEIFPVFLFFTPFYLFFPFSGQLTHTHNLWMFGCSVSCYLSLISCPLTSSLIYAANCFFFCCLSLILSLSLADHVQLDDADLNKSYICMKHRHTHITKRQFLHTKNKTGRNGWAHLLFQFFSTIPQGFS